MTNDSRNKSEGDTADFRADHAPKSSFTDGPEPPLTDGPKPLLGDDPEPPFGDDPEPPLADGPKPLLGDDPEPPLADGPEPLLGDCLEPSLSDESQPTADRAAEIPFQAGPRRQLRRVGTKIGRKVLPFERLVVRLGPLHVFRDAKNNLSIRWLPRRRYRR